MRRWRRLLPGGLVLGFFLLHAGGKIEFPLLQRLENYAYDLRLRWTAPGGVDKRVVIVDIDETKVGTVLGGVRVRHIDELPQIVQTKRVNIGVVATPGAAAQDAADRLVKAGVTSILNFAPIVLSVPRSIEVRKVDLAVELQILSYHEQRRAGGSIHVVPADPSRSATA